MSKQTIEVRDLSDLIRLTLTVKRQYLREAAREIGTSAATLSRATRGKGVEMTLLPRLARWAGISGNELLELLDVTP